MIDRTDEFPLIEISMRKIKIIVASTSPEFSRWCSSLAGELKLSKLGLPTGVRVAMFPVSTYHSLRDVSDREHPDLLLIESDFEKGLDICRETREEEGSRHTGIIFFEGARGADSVESLENGADDYISRGWSQREIIARISSVIRLKTMTDELRHANHRLEVLSITDDLTGLYNMRYFQVFLGKLFKRCMDGEIGFGIIMMDLDRFKSINDSTNHLIGSFIIAEVGKLLRLSSVFGQDACLARYGGDEFIVAVPGDDQTSLVEKAECLKDILASAKFKKDEFEVELTVSLGICQVEAGYKGDINNPIKCADMMLYQSKERGRNRVSAECLGNAVDFDHVRRAHLVNGDASSNDNGVPRFNHIKIFK